MGGLAGHMSHVYEDLNMKFSTFKQILDNVSSGKIDAYEKVDGQNIFFTYDTDLNIAKFARNKGEIKRGGLTLEELSDKFKGRGTVHDAFFYGGKVIQEALRIMPLKDVENMFRIQNTYINCEVMYVDNPNLITYNGNYIVLHGGTLIDPNGNPISAVDKNIFKLFADNISKVETEMVDWKITGPVISAVNNIVDDPYFEEILSKIDGEISKYGLGDNNTIAEYCFMRLVKSILPRLNVPKDMIIGIAQRIMRVDNAPTVLQLKKGKSKNIQSLVSSIATAKFAKQFLAESYYPLSEIVMNYSTKILDNIMSFFSTRNPDEIEVIKKAVTYIDDYVKNLGDENQTKRYMKNMNKLKTVDKITSDMEGIVFRYPPDSKNVYKFTGTFAPVNQILGIMGFEIKDEVINKARKEVENMKLSGEDGIINEIINDISKIGNNRKLNVDSSLGLDKNKIALMSDFCNFCCEKLPIEGNYDLYVVSDRKPRGIKTTAYYSLDDNVIAIYGKNRALVDVLRSIAHELTHMMQNEKGLIRGPIRDAGGFHEDQANAKAGELIKLFAKSLPARAMIYESKIY